jgi:hypothetical protein
MAARAKFTRLANYSRKFGKASHIFVKNGLRRMLASPASTHNTAWRMSVSLASPCNTHISENGCFGKCKYSPKSASFGQVLEFARE